MTAPAVFFGSDNPRMLRAIAALLRRPTTRHRLDEIAGCANGPDLISQLRDLFPRSDNRNEYVSCTRLDFIDRDGRPCKPGVYSFTEKARRLVNKWLARREATYGKRA